MVLEKLIELLCEQLDIEADEVNENTDIVNDLGADSLDVVDLVMTLEDEFDIEIPDDAVENIETYFPIPTEFLPNAETFMLRVKGESMINVGIFDGDNVLVEKQSTARNGEMVVALVEDSATVKTFYKEDGYIRLQPENDTMDPIIVPDCQILGKVIGIFRFLS